MNNFDLLIPKQERSTSSWVWGTVMGVSPLRIRLDGDESPVAVTPETLVTNLSVGQRVWVQMEGRRIIVHGASAGTPTGAGSLWRDPNFETHSTPSNADWSLFWMGSRTVCTYDTTTKIEGTRSIKIYMPSGEPWSGGRLHSQTIFTVTPGAIIEMTMWAKCDVANSPIEFGLLSDVSGNPDFYNGSSTLSWQAPQIIAGTEWGQHKVYIRIPDGHTVARLSINPVNTGRTYWLDGTTSVMSTQAASPVPTGTVQMFAGANLPDGWLWCRGGSFNRLTYPTLAAVVGDTYGTHSGDTYYLPDFRARSPIGIGGTNGKAGNSNAYSLGQKYGDERMQWHNHGGATSSNAHAYGYGFYPESVYNQGYGAQLGGGYGGRVAIWDFTSDLKHAHTIYGDGSGDSGNVHPVLGMNFIIKT